MSASSGLLGAMWRLGCFLGCSRVLRLVAVGKGKGGSSSSPRSFVVKSIGELTYSHAGDLLRDSVSPWVKRGWRCLAELLGDWQRVMNSWGKSAPLVRRRLLTYCHVAVDVARFCHCVCASLV